MVTRVGAQFNLSFGLRSDLRFRLTTYRAYRLAGICGLLCLCAAGCRSLAKPNLRRPSSRVVRCSNLAGASGSEQLSCGLLLGAPAGKLCDDAGLQPHRMRSAFMQGVGFRLADSSVLVAEVALDTLGDDFLAVGDPCQRPVQLITRDWRFLARHEALAKFRSALDQLRRSGARPFDACVVDSRTQPVRRSVVYVVVDDSLARRTLVLSRSDSAETTQNNFVQYSASPLDNLHRDIVITGQQRMVACDDAVHFAEVPDSN